MKNQTWHNLNEKDITGKLEEIARTTLAWAVDRNGNFIYTDMGDEIIWDHFTARCEKAGYKINQ